MQMQLISVRQAALNDLSTVSSILWLKQRNMALWEENEVSSGSIREDNELGLFHIAFCGDIAAGVVKFQTEDLVFWSEDVLKGILRDANYSVIPPNPRANAPLR